MRYGKRHEFQTHHLGLCAETIAYIYKERWQIELFFKEIKQNLRIMRFVGTSQNAAIIQIFTPLTVYLLLMTRNFSAVHAWRCNSFSSSSSSTSVEVFRWRNV